jgi:hypothetical protein
MSKIKIQGDGGGMGTFTIISPNTDSSNTITLPDTSGTLVTSSQSIVPTSDSVYDLGSPTFKWKDLYLSGSTINIGGQTISASATGIVLPQLTIGSGSGSVNLSASATGKLEQTGTTSSGAAVPAVNIPTELNDLSDVDLSVEPTNNQGLFFNEITPVGHHLSMTLNETFSPTTNQMTLLPQTDANRTEGTYTSVTGTSSGSGTVGTYNITVDNTGSTTTLEVVTFGTGHVVDDIITITDADLGAGGAADVTMTVLSIFNERVAGTYTGVTGTTGGTGTVGTFDVTVASGIVSNVVVSTNGSGNSIGDVITIADADLGGGTGTDFTMSVATIDEPSHFSAKNAILEFSDFADVDTVTSPPTNSEVLSWDDTNNNWSPSPNGMPYVVSNVTELLALTNSYTLVGGQKALVTDTNRIYQYTGSAPNSNWRHAVSGWYALASITMSNGKPAAVTGTNATYTLDDLGESIIVTTTVADPEQFPTEWSFEFDTDPAPNTTVTQKYLTTLDGVSNVFTITPGIHPWDSATFNVTFKAKDDSLDTTDVTSEFTLAINVPDWENNANWNSAISNLDFNAADSASMNGISASFYGQSVDVDDRGETIIISDPYYAAPKAGTTGVNAVGAIHIYNKNTTAGVSTWTKNSQTLVDPIDAAGATGGDGNPVSVTNIGGFAGNRGTVDDMSTGDQIALSSDGKNIVSMYGNGANTRAPTFNFDSATNTYLAGDSLYLTDVLDQSGNQDGIYLGPNNTLGQTVLGTQPKLAISKDGNTCILGYGMEGPKGMKFTYGDPRTDHPLISPHGSLDFPEFGHDRHETVNNFGEGASFGKIVTVVDQTPTPTGEIVATDHFLNLDYQPNPNRTAGTYAAITGTSSGTGTVNTFDVTVNADGSYVFPLYTSFGTNGHVIGDVITISDADVGNGGAPDILVTVTATDRLPQGAYNDVGGVTSTGSGTIGTFDVTVDANGIVTSVIVQDRGTGHVVGDVITIRPVAPFASSGGGNSSRDIILNVTTIDQTSNRVAGTYNGVTGTSSGSGVVGKFDVTVEIGGNVSDVTVTNAGYGHTVGDVITITDADLGGGIAPDLTVTVATIESTDIVSSGGIVNDFIDTDVITDTNGARASLDVGQVNYGAAYIFEKTGTGTNTGTPLWNSTNSEWGLTKKISGVNIVDTLGASVDLSADGTVAIASAPRGTADINSLTTTANGGYVTVFDSTTTNGTWTQVTTLRPPTNIIDNSIVATGMNKYVNSLGAPDVLRTIGTYTNVTGTSSGSGFIGHFNITVDALGGVSVENTASFGSGNSIGDIITIADADLGGGGAVDFTMTITNLTGINAQSKRSKFGGSSISISGDGYTIAVGDLGSANENPLATSATLSTHPFVSGCVHIYKKIAGTWTYIETLLSPSGTSQDGFGSGVDLNLNGMVLTVGSINESSLKKNVDGPPNTMLSNSGSMYTFISQDTGNYFLSTGDNTTIGNYKQVKKENILPFENSNTGSLMGRPKITADGKTIVSGHKSLETNNNSGRVEIWTESYYSTLGEIIGLNPTYDLNTDGTSTVIDVTFADLPTNEIWWSFATSNLNGVDAVQEIEERRHATPFDISKSQTDEISEFSSGEWTDVSNKGSVGNILATQDLGNDINGIYENGVGKAAATSVYVQKGRMPSSPEYSSYSDVDSSRIPGSYLCTSVTNGNGAGALFRVNIASGAGNTTLGSTVWDVEATANFDAGRGYGYAMGDQVSIVPSEFGGNGSMITFTIGNVGDDWAMDERVAGTYTDVIGYHHDGTVDGNFHLIPWPQQAHVNHKKGKFNVTVDANGDISNIEVVELGPDHAVGDIYHLHESDINTTYQTPARAAGAPDGNAVQGGAAGAISNAYDPSGLSPSTDTFQVEISDLPNLAVVRRLFGNTNRPRSFKMESLDNVGTANPITTDFDYVALNTTAGFTNPTGTGPENTFIITPHTENTFGGTFDLTITATDGVNTKTATTTLTLPV